jgi:ribose/xylose/arabinose/galactoside ABC-type transport system permease subunit
MSVELDSKSSGPAPPPPRRPTSRARTSSTATIVRTIVPLLLVIIVLSIYTNSRNPAFLSSGNIQNILAQSAALGILAVGQTLLVIGDLSVGSLASLTGVMAAKEFGAGWSTAVVVAMSLLVGAIVGVLWGLIVTYLKVPSFILTLGGLSVFSSAALILSSNTPISVLDGLSTLGFGTWFGLQTPGVVLVVVTVIGGVVLHLTRFGRNVYALGSSAEATYLAGVPTRRVTISMFVVNSMLTAVGGLLLMARLAAGDPRSGSGLELTVVAAIVLGGASLAGGRGSMIGSFLGVLVFGTVTASLTFLSVAGAYQSLVSGAILIFAVVATAAADLRAGRTQSRRPLEAFGQTITRLVLRR